MKLLGLILMSLLSVQVFAVNLDGSWSVGGGYGMPFPFNSETVKDSLDEDWSANGNFRYHFTHKHGLSLEFDHQEFTQQDTDIFSTRGQMLTLNYLHALTPSSSRFYNYLKLGAGAARVEERLSDDYTVPAAKAGLGISYFVTNALNLGLSLNYHFIAREDSDSSDTEFHIFNPTVGLNYYFGAGAPAMAAVKGVVDGDNDGVLDRNDKCPDTPANETVNADGCSASQVDSDNDGVYDSLDRCQGTEAGAKVNSAGCKDDQVVTETLEVKFPSSKATIDPMYATELSKVASFLTTYPDTKAEIEGHTDNRGSRAWNIKLSQMRAEAVKNYLIKMGVDASRLTAAGYGPDRPRADNATKAGRAENRRVVASFTSK